METWQHEGAIGPPASPPVDDAFIEELYRDHARALFGLLLKLTSGDRTRAEDVVQETLLRAWRHREVLDAGRDFIRPWLYTVARRIIIDQQRAQRVRPAEVSGEFLENRPELEDYVDRLLTAHQVREALAELQPRHRAVLLEVYFHGLSVNEAAQVLGIPPGTVKSRTYYALRALRLALAERGVASED